MADEDNLNDITVVVDESDDESEEESPEVDFQSAMRVRKNLSETFDRHVSVADKIARFEAKTTVSASTTSAMLPPRAPTSTTTTGTSTALSVSLRIRPPAAAAAPMDDAAQLDTIEILESTTGTGTTTGRPTTIRTHAPSNSNAAKVVRDNYSSKEYNFSQVFSPETTQEDLYQTVAAPLVQGLFGGDSALLFAYGVTNAGKTHTIMGNSVEEAQWGIIPRALADILGRLQGRELHMSYLEIYNESVYDLLPVSSNKGGPSFKPAALKLRESQDGDIYVKGLVKHRIRNVQEGLDFAKQAKMKRHTSSNNINADSSRSHCICQLELITTAVVDQAQSTSKSVKLWIVDLAGSERTKRTGGVRQKEATRINTSLMKLMRCLSVMREGGVVPFRESKLTHLFMSHLCGPSASRTHMIVNVNPAAADFDETQHVLGYAVSAKSVQIQKALPKKKGVIGYDLSGHRQLSRLVKKYSPKILGKRKAAVESDDRATKRPAAALLNASNDRAIKRDVASNDRAIKRGGASSEDQLRKEIKTLQASLSIAQAEVESLHLTREEQTDELAHIEETVRAEVSDEMEQHFQSTREDYDRIIENLQNQVKSNPVGARSEKKVKMDKAEKMIEELVDKVEECEEEMVRMRGDHEAEMKRLENEHRAGHLAAMEVATSGIRDATDHSAALSAQMSSLTEEHAAEIRDLQASKDESTAFYQEQIQELEEKLGKEDAKEEQLDEPKEEPLAREEAKEEQLDEPKEENSQPRRLPRSRTSKVACESAPKSVRMPFGPICENAEEGDLVFPKKPTPLVDGTYSRPSGRAPKGREWDTDRGAWRLSIC